MMRCRLRADEGTTATEFALILPVLLLFLLGIMEGGRVLSTWVVLTNETREAARYGVAGVRDGVIYNGGDASTLVSQVDSYARSRIGQELNTANLTVTTTIVPPGTDAGTVTVLSQYQVPMVTPLMNSVLGTVTVRAESSMRAE